MDIVYSYKKVRKQFGRNGMHFTDLQAVVLCNFQPDKNVADQFTQQFPTACKSVQATPTYSFHQTNTETKEVKQQGMMHEEGGWPKDVNAGDTEAKKRYINKVWKEDKFFKSMKHLTGQLGHIVNQNMALNIYEDYFPEGSNTASMGNVSSMIKAAKSVSSATVLTIFKDPCKVKRAANRISFIPSDGKKVAIAYCIPQNNDAHEESSSEKHSYIWDTHNPNEPDMMLSPTSSLTCIEYNPKDTAILLGGAINGTLFVFDTRRGSQSVDYSHIEKSHRDPVYDVKWLQSKTGAECCSISTDGQVLIWDTRNLGNPVEDYLLEIKPSKSLVSPYTGVLGAISLNYDPSYSTAKLLLGTEQGMAVTWNRKTKKKEKQIERSFLGHHGPIYTVQRNPFLNKYILTIGDWTARVWFDEMRSCIMETRYHASYMTSGCWSSSRPGVFFTTKMDGSADIWDLLYSHRKPLVSVQLSDSALYCVQQYDGQHLAIGSADGNTYYMELSPDLVQYESLTESKSSVAEEKALMQAMFDRETRREKTLEAQRVKDQMTRNKKLAPIMTPVTTQTPATSYFQATPMTAANAPPFPATPTKEAFQENINPLVMPATPISDQTMQDFSEEELNQLTTEFYNLL